MKKRRRNTVRLETLLNDVETPVFLLDARRRFVSFNGACEKLTGWKSDEIVGTTCEYAGDGDAGVRETLTASLCPPPEVFAGQPASVPAYIPHRNGDTATRRLSFIPLADETGRAALVLGVASSLEQTPRLAATSAAQELHAELAAQRGLLRQRFSLKGLVARSAPMLRVLTQVNVARAADAPLLLVGEPGTGKEHLARIVHYQRTQPGGAFVPLDCRALPAHELKQTLKRLLQETPRGGERTAAGTLYLQNSDVLPRDLQELVAASLSPTGKERPANLRLMAAVTEDPEGLVEREVFLPDFYYLLTSLRIDLPPLRERRDDLPLLAQSFLEHQNRAQDKQIGGCAEDVWKQFREYGWPGNLDELITVIQEAWTAAPGDQIRIADLPFRFRTGLDAQTVGPRTRADVAALETVLTQAETDHIQLALERSGYNKSRAAKLLGIPRAKLYRRMQVLGIEDREEVSSPLSQRERGRG